MFRQSMYSPFEPRERAHSRGCHERGFARFGGRHEHFERSFGGGRERLFDSGDLQLIILQLVAEKPSYGYELIKAIEARMAGGYAPSPGVVYPTLTLLEERGLIRIESSEGGRKVYGVTDAGKQELADQAARLREVAERVEQSGRRFRRGRSPELMRAFMELRNAIRSRMTREGITPEQITKIAEAVEQAARNIDKI